MELLGSTYLQGKTYPDEVQDKAHGWLDSAVLSGQTSIVFHIPTTGRCAPSIFLETGKPGLKSGFRRY